MKTRKARTKKAYARNIVLVFSFLLLILLNVATTFAYFGRSGLHFYVVALGIPRHGPRHGPLSLLRQELSAEARSP